MYKTTNAGADWQLILPESESFPATEFLNGKAESINQIQVLDVRIYLFNGYYDSKILYSDDWGQTWVFWFQSLIAHYYQMYRCSSTYYLYGLAGDGFRTAMFEIPAMLFLQQNVTNFYSGCHNASPNCYYSPDGSSIPQAVAYFDDVVESICSLRTVEADELKTALFPNPVHDIFKIRSDNPILKVAIYNLLGQSQASFRNTALCNIGNLAFGSYLAAIETEKGLTTMKLVKE